MLLFIDGFDHYATADGATKWNSFSGPPTIAASSGRRGGGALETVGAGTKYASKTFSPAGASFVVGFAYKPAIPAGSVVICDFQDAGTTQCQLQINSDGTLQVTRNGTAVTGGTSTNALNDGVWVYVEWKFTIADSIGANSCKVRVNGTDWITVATGQDIKNTANASANSVRLGKLTNTTTDSFFDDFYLCDQSGSANNDFLGDSRIDTLYPNGDGFYQTWTPSTGTQHFALVNGHTPQITNYNSDGTAANKDTYDFENLTSITGSIFGVQVNAYAQKSDSGARSIKIDARSGTTDSAGASQALATAPAYYLRILEQDPATSAAWTESGFNAAQFGPETV